MRFSCACSAPKPSCPTAVRFDTRSISHAAYTRGQAAGRRRSGFVFIASSKGQEEHYRIRRTWRMVNGRCREKFSVCRNGKTQPVLADNWAAQVEDYFPTNIAHLFLFDGEQVEAYASQEQASALLGSAIQNLLGLDLVDRLEKDLQVYERRKRVETNEDALVGVIAVMENDLDTLRRRIDSLAQERAGLRTHSIDRTERKLDDVQQKYRRLGGALYDQREVIEKRSNDAKRALKDGQVALREFAAGAAPLLLVRRLLECVDERDRREEASRRARHVAEALTETRLRSPGTPEKSIHRGLHARCARGVSIARPRRPKSPWAAGDRAGHSIGGFAGICIHWYGAGWRKSNRLRKPCSAPRKNCVRVRSRRK